MRPGLIHLYTGDGKGKTTAALGLILRAYGRGKRVVLALFLKGRDSGEVYSLEKLPGVTVLQFKHEFGLFDSADSAGRSEIRRQNDIMLTEVIHIATEELCDLLVLDEICAAYNKGAIDRELADRLIMDKPRGLELVLTVRNAPQHFIEAADYVTEFLKRKHPFDHNVAAREGVEF